MKRFDLNFPFDSIFGLLIGSLLLTFSSCGQKSPGGDAAGAHTVEAGMVHSGHGGHAALPDGVALGRLERRVLAEPIACRGTVHVPPAYHATVYAPVDAFVERLDVLPGQRVRQGQTLAVLRHPALLRLQEDYLDARAEWTLQQQTRARREGLDSLSALSAGVRDRDQAAFAQADARRQSLEAQLRMVGLDPERVAREGIAPTVALRAPITGFASRVFLNRGALADADKPVLEIVDDSHRHIELTVFPADQERVAKGQKIRYRLSGGSAWHAAEVHLIGTQVDAETQGVVVHGHPEGPMPSMAVGSVVQAEILAGQDSVWALPEAALHGGPENPEVWVKGGDGHWTLMPITTGRRQDGWVEVLDASALTDHDIVTAGAWRFVEEAPEHSH